MKIFAKHKKLDREFKVIEWNAISKTVKCEGEVQGGYCIYCDVDKPCSMPEFKFDDVEFRVDIEDKGGGKKNE